MGRPPIGERALTPAEKMRRYRAKKFGNKAPVTEPMKNGNAASVTESDLLAAMPKTTRAKAEAWQRRAEKRIEDEIERRVRAGIAKHIDEVLIPHYREKGERAEAVIAARKGVVTKAEFRTLQRCLHPDSRALQDESAFTEALTLLDKHQAVLVKPDAPKFNNPLPSSAELRAKYRRR